MASSTDVPPRPERLETDDSLRVERENTDLHLERLHSARDQDADKVVERARERADDLLDASRSREDEAVRPNAAVAGARADEDVALDMERTAADDKLADERDEQDKALERLLAIEREDTDLRLRHERARADRAVASRDEFLAMVSHDVRGILGGIAMSTDLIAQLAPGGASGARSEREVERIRRLTLQMNRLVGDLLDVVSMESGSLSIDAAEHDAALVLAETLENFQLASAARKVEISCDVGTGNLVAMFDRDRIVQVLTNLVGNAIKFTPIGGTIALSLVANDHGLQFSVRDSGRGIALDQIEIMFERFSQAAQADRRGLGLGLYISRCIVTAHGGRIWAESELGKGSKFFFTVPSRSAPTA